MINQNNLKEGVRSFWNEASCGENLLLDGFKKEDYLKHSERKYELEPEIIEFAEFPRYKNKKHWRYLQSSGSSSYLRSECLGSLLS